MVRVREVKYDKVIVREQEVFLKEGVNCLIGPSGLGKSTFLKVLNEELKWPFVPQEPSLPPYATPLDLAEYQSKFNSCSKPKEMVSNFLKISEELGIRDKLERKVGKLSSGEKQRVSVALALARGCKGLLADEPTSQLDPSNAIKVMEEISKRSAVSLVVTHDLAAMIKCDRFYTLVNGYLRESSPEEALGLDWDEICFRHFNAKDFKSSSNSSSTS